MSRPDTWLTTAQACRTARQLQHNHHVCIPNLITLATSTCKPLQPHLNHTIVLVLPLNSTAAIHAGWQLYSMQWPNQLKMSTAPGHTVSQAMTHKIHSPLLATGSIRRHCLEYGEARLPIHSTALEERCSNYHLPTTPRGHPLEPMKAHRAMTTNSTRHISSTKHVSTTLP